MSIVAVSSFSYSAAILPFWIAHYAPLVDRCVLIVEESRSPGLWKEVERIANGRAELIPGSERWRRTGITGPCKEEARVSLGLTADDWLIPTDPDEFVRWPKPPRALVAEALRVGWLGVMGRFVDRVAASRKLEPMRLDVPLSEQYPLELPVTSQIIKVSDTKIVLARGDVELRSGHHGPAKISKLRMRKGAVKIDHYKFRAGLAEAYQERMKRYEEGGSRYCLEGKRFLEHLEKHGGRIAVGEKSPAA